MKLTLERRFFAETYTIGALYIDGQYFCDTVEDRYRDLKKEAKVYGKTAIPYGTYRVTVTWSPSKKRNLPRLHDVPAFEGILIHRGNTAADSEGCIIVGENRIKGGVVNSTATEARLVALLSAIQGDGEPITIEVRRK